MSRIGLNEFNFNKNFSLIETENKKELEAIFQSEALKNLVENSSDAHKEKINQNCKKILHDINFYYPDANVSENFELNITNVKTREKEIEAFKNKWNSCVEKYKEIETDKNNSINNLMLMNGTFFQDCINDCKIIRNAKEQQSCLRQCYDYHKLNSTITTRLMRDVLLKYLNDLKIV